MPTNLSWTSLRSWAGSQHAAFEHLCAALAHRESVPATAVWSKNGRPDGGVECRWNLPSGDVWAWQAKWFLASLGQSQWKQLDESVQTALAAHPRLRRYFVCFPQDLPDAPQTRHNTARAKWDQYVIKWKQDASVLGIVVEFVLWDESAILERLSQHANAGLVSFWFGKHVFDDAWFSKQLKPALLSAGPRYTRETHVDVPGAVAVWSLGWDEPFHQTTKKLRDKLYEAKSRLQGYLKDDIAGRPILSSIDGLREALRTNITDPDVPFDSAALSNMANNLVYQIDDIQEASSSGGLKDAKRRLADATIAVSEFAQGSEAQAASNRCVVLTGTAGNGKTHLLCDVFRQRVEIGKPTLLVFGEHFANADPLAQLPGMFGLNCSPEEFLQALDAAGEAAGTRTVLMIDALNEGYGLSLWPSRLSAFVSRVLTHPHLALALSIRTPYEETIFPSPIDSQMLTIFPVEGFAGVEYEALRSFCIHYEIRLPSVAPLDPEFRNPLFLKTYCQSIRHHGLKDVPDGVEGISALRNFYLDGLNKQLSRADRLDYAADRNLVRAAVEKIADLILESKSFGIDIEQAFQAIDALLPGRPHSRSLFGALISEGIIAKSLSWVQAPTVESDLSPPGVWKEIIRFGYERLTDHMLVDRLLTRSSKDAPLELLMEFLQARHWRDSLLEAATIQIAERFGCELLDQPIPEQKLESASMATARGILWRHPSSLGDHLGKLLEKRTKEFPRLFGQLVDVLLTCSARPNHRYNARRLDHILRADSMGERDIWWNYAINRRYTYGRHEVTAVIDWALSATSKSTVGDDSLFLAALTLGWFFTTPNRSLRDRATKALVALLRDRLAVCCQIVEHFHDVDDPYVVERVYAAAYGAAMLTPADTAGLKRLSELVYRLVFASDVPPDMLLRDYARGICELAVFRELNCLGIDPARIRPPYWSTWPPVISTRSELAKFYDIENYASAKVRVWHSVLEDDFARYTLGTNSGNTRWSGFRIHSDTSGGPKVTINEFVATLNAEQQQQYKTFLKETNGGGRWYWSSMTAEGRSATENFLTCLNDEQRRICEELVFPALGGNHHMHGPGKNQIPFNIDLLQRFILERISRIDVDWSRMKDLDELASYVGRNEHRAERLGKKYQWIAYQEAMARIADNFQWRIDDWSIATDRYDGPWQLFGRDIDPSAITNPRHVSTSKEERWWLRAKSIPRPDTDDDLKWIGPRKAFGDPRELLMATDPSGTAWYCVSGSVREGDEPSEEERDQGKRWRRLTVGVRAFLTKQSEAEAIRKWCDRLDWGNECLPGTSSEGFLGEHGWAPAYAGLDDPTTGPLAWGDTDRFPFRVMPLAAWHSLKESEYDFSQPHVDDEDGASPGSILLPCGWLVREMGLRWTGGANFVDRNGKLVCFDPAESRQGPSALLVHVQTFNTFLAEQDLAIVWVVNGERMVMRQNSGEFIGHAVTFNAFTCRDSELVGRFRPEFVTYDHSSEDRRQIRKPIR